MSHWSKVRVEFNEIVNRHFDSPEYHRLFSVKLTPARKQILDIHYPHYIKSRRDCWAASMNKAPLDVKRAIWEHEKDELIYDKRMDGAHLTDEDMAKATAEANLLPGAKAALWAWFYLSTTRSWIESLTINHTTERKNNSEVVKGGGFTTRMALKRVQDLGGTVETLDRDTQVHMTADIDHSDMFEPIYEKYIVDEQTGRAVLQAARDSLDLDRAYRGALASAMVEIGDSKAA